jgi:hypothetical protein
VYFEILAR